MAGNRSKQKGLCNIDYCITRAEKKLVRIHKMFDIRWMERADGTYKRSAQLHPSRTLVVVEMLEKVMDEIQFFLDTKAGANRLGPPSREVTQHTKRKHKDLLQRAGVIETTPSTHPQGEGGLFIPKEKSDAKGRPKIAGRKV